MKMSTVVRKSSKIIAPFLFTYGIYLIIYGHLSPGGGFQGGVILAVGIILLLTSHGYKLVHESFQERLVKVTESTAVLGIILLGLSGLIFQAFFYNYLSGGTPGTLFSGGTIVLFNILVGVKIGTGFTIVFYVFLRRMESD
ncbi:MAG: cation:proton antiporter [Candidatus Thermoplasmatota archaeon]|nr:cation:proton antiporter [Candidatus Thermoplasmatota archaeon]